MDPIRPSISLVLPVLDGAPLLAETLDRALGWLRTRPGGGELIVVDDGSTDRTPEVLAARADPELRVITHGANRGKGAAVRTGMLAAAAPLRVFLDAGLAYPVENLDRIEAALRSGADVAIGSRLHPESRYVLAPRSLRRLSSRHRMGRLFNLAVRVLAVPGIRDTQAGVKGFAAAAAEALFPLARLDGFAFDVEILFLARRLGLRIDDVPVRFVYEEEPSTLRLFRDGFRMLRDLAALRRRDYSDSSS